NAAGPINIATEPNERAGVFARHLPCMVEPDNHVAPTHLPAHGCSQIYVDVELATSLEVSARAILNEGGPCVHVEYAAREIDSPITFGIQAAGNLTAAVEVGRAPINAKDGAVAYQKIRHGGIRAETIDSKSSPAEEQAGIIAKTTHLHIRGRGHRDVAIANGGIVQCAGD